MLHNEYIPVRLSHLLSYHGVGAIVRGPHGLMVVHDIREWTDAYGALAGRRLLYVERVRTALGIEEHLQEPPVASKERTGPVRGVCIPASPFPSWTRCPSCGTLYRWPWKKQLSDTPRCTNPECQSRANLEQLPWVLAHPLGYLADVPWHFLTHQDARQPKQRECKVYDAIKLREGNDGARILRCTACGAEARFRGNEYISLVQGLMQPWTKDDPIPFIEGGHTEMSGDIAKAQVLAVNDVRVYLPVTQSALVIPPESRVRKGTVVDHLYRNSEDRRRIDTAKTRLAKKSAIKTLATRYHCAPHEIEKALQEIEQGYPLYGENLTEGQLLESEYAAFLEILPDQREDEDLVTHNQTLAWHDLAIQLPSHSREQSLLHGVRNLVRVDRLKAVKVFKGFTRIKGADSTDLANTIVPPDIVGKSDWLPAIELYGEGIFFTLDEGLLQKWERSPVVEERLQQILPRFLDSGRRKPNPLTARFMLLHTLSHLLMRQIASESGYPAASLIERIYCNHGCDPMAGILIHVAVPDVAGSLGGLAELCEPQKFLRILLRALEHAEWCSLDPVCSEHEGQGPNLLNRAACHACTLVPEPACAYGNILLDRAFVKGDIATGLPSFFGGNYERR